MSVGVRLAVCGCTQGRRFWRRRRRKIFTGVHPQTYTTTARPYNTCIVKLKVSLLLYNFMDKGNTELQSSLFSLLVTLSMLTFFSSYKLVTIDSCFVVFFHFCVEFLLQILFACFVAIVHFCDLCTLLSSKFKLRPSNHTMSCLGAVGLVRESSGRVTGM